MDNATSSGILTTVETSLEIVDAIAELEGARVTELAEHLDLAPSTVHGHLATLHKHSYLTKEGDEYYVGFQFLNQGGRAQTRKDGYKLAEKKLRKIASETGERAQFIVEKQGRGYYLYKATGNDAVEADARVGKRIYLHASAAGKSILSQLPKGRVEEIIDQWGLPKFNDQTITDRGELFDELEQTSQRGYAINCGESHEGLNAVGVPVHTPQNEVLGAFSISGPSGRLKDDRLDQELPEFLEGEINELELNLSYL
jgi:DNA-binding IclR family transcriptional regulator